MQIVDKDVQIRRLEKSVAQEIPIDCITCAEQTVVIEDLRETRLSLVNENARLREVLSWLYAKEPQLRMIIEMGRRGEGDTSGLGQGECSTSGKKRAPVMLNTTPFKPPETLNGVHHEPPRACPKEAVLDT